MSILLQLHATHITSLYTSSQSITDAIFELDASTLIC